MNNKKLIPILLTVIAMLITVLSFKFFYDIMNNLFVLFLLGFMTTTINIIIYKALTVKPKNMDILVKNK